MVENKKIGTRLMNLRKTRGLTQKDLAEMFGLSRPLISMYESGVRLPSPHIMKKYSTLFNATVDDIFFK